MVIHYRLTRFYAYTKTITTICGQVAVRSGLISIRKASIKTYTDAALNSDRGLSDNTVLSLYQRPNDQRIWIGTDGGGINSFDPGHRKIQTLSIDLA